MTMASTLRRYLDRWGVEYDVLHHPYSFSSQEAAEVAHVPGDKLAKCVVTEDEHGYLMVVLPASHQVAFERLDAMLHRRLELATEDELEDLFQDCEPGAMPPLGEAYGIDVLLDVSLMNCDEVFFEAGDHTELIHLRGEDFRDMMADADRGSFSRHQ